MTQKPTSATIRRTITFLLIIGACIVLHHSASGQQRGDKIYVHTDKDEYLAGELIWFRLHFADALSLKTPGEETTAYTELVDAKGKSVLQGKLPTGHNGGDGSFYLPPQLPSGAYTFEAYTSQIKQSGSKYYFRKTIRIINTISTSKVIPVAQKQAVAFIGFFPEGGNVLADQPAKFGFCVLDPNTKKGLQASGVITDEKNDTLTHISTLRFGLGQFIFTPRKNVKYHASVILADGTVIKKEFIPQITGNPYALSVNEQNGKFVIKSYFKPVSPGISTKAYLLFHAQSQSKHLAEIDFNNGFHEYQIDRTKLGEGVTSITLLDANKQPVCERLIFTAPKSASSALGITTNKNIFGKRENVRIETALINTTDTTQNFNGSLSVTWKPASQKDESSGIYEYMWLTAGLNGVVEAPSFYFSEEAKREPQYQENLLLVHGWRYFDPAGPSTKPVFESKAELKGHTITARVIDNWNNMPKPGVLCALSTPSSPFGFYTATSDKNGIVRFIVENYYGPGSIVIKAHNSSPSSSCKFELVNPFGVVANIDSLSPGLVLDEADSTSLIARSIAMQVRNTFQFDQLNEFQIPSRSDTFPFFGKPEFSYLLDDYTRFSTIEEVLREYVTSIMVSLKDSKLKLSIFDEKTKAFYSDGTLVLLDGVPLNDVNQIFNYDAYKVKKIDVVPRRYRYGGTIYNGIVSFETYKAQFDAIELDPSAFTVDYEGLQLKRTFHSPVYMPDEKGDPRIPDYRTTLLWQPYLELKSNGIGKMIDSYSSDFPGTYEIVINGATTGGEPLQKVVKFEVK
ncbi:hypothetical protein LZZ85_06895 [Terrimonas sp. NA20]|uniref:Macroglobulin domain-containing protein n=1 Tax=Terrimonas ginsenosidimutans TaxID=2908004 RepID=A0ABS9KNT9_9BACT|nr:hypothetical protein [Terrimonas ginsenosidimutans]MCG2614000.1 hypothetical protein [Terrimonas ginsenosidimutans]